MIQKIQKYKYILQTIENRCAVPYQFVASLIKELIKGNDDHHHHCGFDVVLVCKERAVNAI